MRLRTVKATRYVTPLREGGSLPAIVEATAAISIALMMLTIAGCRHTRSSDGADVEFSTDREGYAPGAEVELRLENRSDETIGYNLCFSALERQSDDTWVPVPDPETVCTTIQHGLDPGEEAAYEKLLMMATEEGRYRFRTEIEHRSSGRQESLATNFFEVVR